MEPVCIFALFAQAHEAPESQIGIDLRNVIARMEVPTDPSEEPGYVTIDLTLYVQVFAEEGHHTLLVTARGFEKAPTADFEILPEHNNLYLIGLKRAFPLLQTPVINEFPLLLDGRALATAYLVSMPTAEYQSKKWTIHPPGKS